VNALSYTLTAYLAVGVLGGGVTWFFVSTALSEDWAAHATDDGEDSVAERRLTRAELKHMLNRVPGKNERGAAMVISILVCLLWPIVVTNWARRR